MSTDLFVYCRQLQGLNINPNPSVLAIDDQQVVYVAGHNIVIYNIEKKTSQFIQGKYSIPRLSLNLAERAARVRMAQINENK